MSLYTTPLQFGYFFSLLMWILFIIRGYREQRLSDKLLGWIMFILATELQDYTFGFAGINILWNELNGFPRGLQLLFGPVVYFYFRAQVNRQFHFEKGHLWHFLPYTFAFFYELIPFLQGPEAVESLRSSTHFMVLGYANRILMLASFIYYLSRCMIIYKRYRKWSLNQFSNTELINFNWFRNFLYAMIFWLLFREIMNIFDMIMDLDFYQDWWWNLALVVVVVYIGLAGYEQSQPAKINFQNTSPLGEEKLDPKLSEPATSTGDPTEVDEEKSAIANKLRKLMEEDKLYIQADLSLHELAQHLKVNTVQLSATINQAFNQNFNDFVNSLRIEEFIRLYREDVNKRFTLLSIALDSGFNSKATFNRAFKKIKGASPKEYLDAPNSI
ncbi:MAG: AraC family transcriptional regulator [Ekhidna sp.]|nr:AraC family transcriptional regulator [Ekhidna sp.]